MNHRYGGVKKVDRPCHDHYCSSGSHSMYFSTCVCGWEKPVAPDLDRRELDAKIEYLMHKDCS